MAKQPSQAHGFAAHENCPGAATTSVASSGAYTTNCTATLQSCSATVQQCDCPDTECEEITRLLNSNRLATYFRAAGGQFDQALRLYAWNIEVSSEFWGGFSILEVTVRNVLHSQLSAMAGREDWWKAEIGLHPFDQRRIADAIAAVDKAKENLASPGHVIAELNLGFWTGLLANRYHQRLWVPALSNAFPHLEGKRRDLHRRLESLRKLRNRIAHHEPIFRRNLLHDHDQLLTILAAISLVASEMVEQHSRVPQVVSRKDTALNGSHRTTF